MKTRFDIERAVLASTLPPRPRHLMHVLCVRIDAKTNTILAAFQPSLTDLASDTRRDRRTVQRDLNVLERAGWVIRRRPPIEKARKEHARTHYTLRIPDTEKARDQSPPAARGNAPDGLEAGERGARGHRPPRSSGHQRSSDELTEIIEAIRKHAGVEIDQEWAARVRDQVVGDRHVANAGAYVAAAVKRAPVDTYVPTRQPPSVKEVLEKLNSRGTDI